MANDYNGDPIAVGTVYVYAGAATDASGDFIPIGPRNVVALSTDLIPITDVGGGSGVSELNDLTDVSVSSPSPAEVLRYDGFGWSNAALVVADISDAGALAELDTVGTSEIDDAAVTYAKVQNVSATNKLLGRVTAGAGAVEEIDCTPAGRALLDDADAAAQRTTLGIASAFLLLDCSNDPLTGDLLIDGGTLSVHKSVVGGEQVLDLYNSASSGASGTRFQIRTRSGSTGDAWFRFENSSRYYSVGLDTSEDEFRIGTGAVLSSSNLLRLTSAGVLHVVGAANFGGDVALGSTSSGSYSLIVNSAFSTQSDIELRQGGLTNARLALLAGGGAEFQVDGTGLGSPSAIWGVTTGGLMDMKGKRVTNLADPVDLQDAATPAWTIITHPALAQNGLDYPNKATFRTNIGLGNSATRDVGTASTEVASGDIWTVVFDEEFEYVETARWNNTGTGTAAAYHQDVSALSGYDDQISWGSVRIHCGTSTGTGSYSYFVMDEVGQLGRMLSSTEDWILDMWVSTLNEGNLKASWGLTNVTPTQLRPDTCLCFVADNNTDTNIYASTYDGTTTNDTDTGEANESIDVNGSGSIRKFTITCRANNVEFFIDDSSVASFTSDLPAASESYFSPYFFCQEDGATFRGLIVDRVRLMKPAS